MVSFLVLVIVKLGGVVYPFTLLLAFVNGALNASFFLRGLFFSVILFLLAVFRSVVVLAAADVVVGWQGCT